MSALEVRALPAEHGVLEGVSVKRSRMRACARLGNDLHYVVCTRILFRDARPGDVVSQFGGKPDTISTLVDGGSTETL